MGFSKRKDNSIMKTQELAYKPYGIGSWTHVTVSKDVAEALASEYSNYGWEVKIDGNAIDTKLALKAA
jgi:hypothetical protein